MFSIRTAGIALFSLAGFLVSSCDFSEEAEQCNQVNEYSFLPEEEKIVLSPHESRSVRFKFVTPNPRKITLHSELPEQIIVGAHPHHVDRPPMILPQRKSAVISHVVSPENPIVFNLKFSLVADHENPAADTLLIDELASVELGGEDTVTLSAIFYPELKCSPTYSNDGYMSAPVNVRIQREAE